LTSRMRILDSPVARIPQSTLAAPF